MQPPLPAAVISDVDGTERGGDIPPGAASCARTAVTGRIAAAPAIRSFYAGDPLLRSTRGSWRAMACRLERASERCSRTDIERQARTH